MAPSTGKSPMGTQTSSGSQKISTEILVGWPPQNAPPKVSTDNHEFNYESISNPQKAKKYIFAYICIEYETIRHWYTITATAAKSIVSDFRTSD